RLRKTMRRVRLEKLCATKKCQAEPIQRRGGLLRSDAGRALCSPGRSVSAAGTDDVSAVRSSTSSSPTSIAPHDGGLWLHRPLCADRVGSGFLEPVADAVQRLDHIKIVVDDLELLAQSLDVAVDSAVVHVHLVVIS